MKAFSAVFIVAAALLAVSCAPVTPEARIERDPEKFAALPAKQQEQVRKGVVAKGMSRDAVLLAMGRPSVRVDSVKDGKATERWDYAGSYPVTSHPFGYSPWGHWGGHYHGYGYGWGPAVTYLPYTKAQVWFVDGKVDSWERARPRTTGIR